MAFRRTLLTLPESFVLPHPATVMLRGSGCQYKRIMRSRPFSLVVVAVQRIGGQAHSSVALLQVHPKSEADEGDVVLGKPDCQTEIEVYPAYEEERNGCSLVVRVDDDEVGPVAVVAPLVCAVVAPVAELELHRQTIR